MFKAAGERGISDAASARLVLSQHRASLVQREKLKPRLGAYSESFVKIQLKVALGHAEAFAESRARIGPANEFAHGRIGAPYYLIAIRSAAADRGGRPWLSRGDRFHISTEDQFAGSLCIPEKRNAVRVGPERADQSRQPVECFGIDVQMLHGTRT